MRTPIATWLPPTVARLLATRAAAPLILTGTLALAGLSAAAMQPTGVQHSPLLVPSTAVSGTLDLSAPRTFCYANPDGNGPWSCHILASQVNTVPNLGCHPDPDGDGTYICFYATMPPTTR
jgi:hypothetical protein